MPLARENVARKARVENWKSRQRSGRGGGQEYAIEILPQATQAALSASNLDQTDSVPIVERVNWVRGALWTKHDLDRSLALPTQTVFNVTLAETPAEASANRAEATRRKTEQRTDSWLEILKAYEFWRESKRFDSALVRELEFIEAYNKHQLCLPDWIYYHVPRISHSTLKRKDKLRRTADKIDALGGNYGNRRNQGRIDSNLVLQEAIESCIAAGGKHWGPSQIYDILLLEFGYELEDFSLGQLRAWMRKFRCENPQKWAIYMDANRAKGTTTPAFGSRAQGIKHPNQVWEIDSFWNDVVLK